MTRRLTLTVRERILHDSHDWIQPGDLVPDVTLRIRGRFRIPYHPMTPTMRLNATLVRGDADGRLSAEIPVQLSPPFVSGPVYVQLSAPGFDTGSWFRIPEDGDVTRHVTLRRLSPDEMLPAIDRWDYSARVTVDGQASIGQPFRRTIRDLRGWLVFDRNTDMLRVESFPTVRVDQPFGTLVLNFQTPITGDYDHETRYTDLNVTAHAALENGNVAASADFLLSSDGSVPGRNMSGFERRLNSVRLVGSGVFEGSWPVNGQDMGLEILFRRR